MYVGIGSPGWIRGIASGIAPVPLPSSPSRLGDTNAGAAPAGLRNTGGDTRPDRHRRPPERPVAPATIPGRHVACELLRPAGSRVIPVGDEVGEQRDLLALVVDAPRDE